jgi:hypothetical protein
MNIEMMTYLTTTYPNATAAAVQQLIAEQWADLEAFKKAADAAVIEHQPRITQHSPLTNKEITLTKDEYIERWTATVSDLPMILADKRATAIRKEIANAAADEFHVIYAAQQ